MTHARVSIEVLTHPDETLCGAVNALLSQLSRSAPPLTLALLTDIVRSPCNTVFLARELENKHILGMLTLVHFRISSGLRAWIEDVVVDEAARGIGAGKALVQAAVQHSQSLQVRSLDLTSNPARTAAHQLYESTGFRIRDTHVYRFHPSTVENPFTSS